MPKPTLPTKQPRIYSFDIIRGFFLLLILVNHLPFAPAGYDFITGRGHYWTSAAEGFFFISGLMVGLVRKKDFMSDGFRAAAKKMWIRGGFIYLWYLATAFGLTIVATLLVSNGIRVDDQPQLILGPYSEIISKTILMRNEYGWIDFLSYFAVIMMFTPFVLWLVARRKTMWMILITMGLWLIPQFMGDPATFVGYLLTWQAYYFLGVPVGYYYHDIVHWLSTRLSAAQQKIALRAVYGLALVSFAASWAYAFLQSFADQIATPILSLVGLRGWGEAIHNAGAWLGAQVPLQEYLVFNNRVAPLRIVVFAVWMTALYLFIHRHEAAIIRRFGKIFLPTGQNSLFVFVFEGLLTSAFGTLLVTGSLLHNFLWTTVALGIVVGVAMLRQRTKSMTVRELWANTFEWARGFATGEARKEVAPH